MKTKHLKTGMLMLCVAVANIAFAMGGGSIMGQVKDPDTELPVAGIKVEFKSASGITYYETNDQGFYYASNIAPGIYTVTVRYMNNVSMVEEVKISNDQTQNVDLSLSMISVTGLDTVVIRAKGRNPIIDPLNMEIKVLTAGDLKVAPVLNITGAIETLSPGVIEMDGQLFVRGSRGDGLAYYIDGCKITGNPNVPICGVDMMQVYTGYVPAKFGDTIAGVVAIETRNFFTE